MSGLPAARITDKVAHKWGASGDIIEGSPNVRLDRECLPAARVGDKVRHGWGTCVITEGEPTVRINGRFAARVIDAVSCGGRIASGSPTVRIGRAVGQAAPSGQAQSNPANNALAGQRMCLAAVKGRNLNTLNRRSRNLTAAMQSYSNCGVESARQIINQVTGRNITEDGLLQWALDNNLALRDNPNVPIKTPPTKDDGATGYTGIWTILDHYNISSVTQPNNLNNIKKALASGKGVIAHVDSGVLWNNISDGKGHAVLVTGLEYDNNGKVTDVIVNDTGAGECSQKVPLNTWNKAVNAFGKPGNPALLNVTNQSIF